MDTMRRKQRGLTLVELMVTLAVAIILLAVGMPLFTGMAANNRAAANVNALVTALNLARSEAVGRGDVVGVAANGGSWKDDGWVVFHDVDADGNFDAGEELRIWEAPLGNAEITGGATVTFDYTGVASTQTDFDLDLTDATGLVRRCVTVTTTGQIRTKREQSGVAWACP